MRIAVISGGFDPLHRGHIKYIKAASELGDRLIVALNSDEWLSEKKGRAFMPWNEREAILMAMEKVDDVIYVEDDELGSCINALEAIKDFYPKDEIIFCNGGDRNIDNIPETIVQGIQFEYGVGGAKSNSSTWILNKWGFTPTTTRNWGQYSILHQYPDGRVKVKELVVDPGQRISFQKHKKRSELWFVAEGIATIRYDHENVDYVRKQFETFRVEQGHWHQLINEQEVPLRIVEIQYGEETIEEDIIRKELKK